jgi:PAS domain S-box-containing protein
MTTHEGEEDLKAEIARLRARVEELERSDPPPDGHRAPLEDVPYWSILNDLPLALSVYRPDGLIVEVNELSCQLYGTTRELILGNFNIVEDREANEKGFTDGFRRALAGEVASLPPASYETMPSHIHPGPSRRVWTQAIFYPVRDASGEVKLVTVVSLDVTALMEAEARQRRSTSLLHAIIDNAPLLIYARDIEGRHIMMNRRTTEFYGRSSEECLGKTPHELTSKEIADTWSAQDLEAIAADAPISVENKVMGPEGERFYITSKFALRDEEGRAVGVCGITVDITERVRAEERSRQLQEEMLRTREETLRTISTPLLPIARGVLLMPLVGEVTRERAKQLLEALLRGVAAQRARIAILDVTGVPEAGADVVDAIIQAARGVRLLGGELVLTGIRPRVAQALSLVEVRTELEGIATQATLERGVARALLAQDRQFRRSRRYTS